MQGAHGEANEGQARFRGQVKLAQRSVSLHDRLAERRPEIERAMRDRVFAIADPGWAADPGYAEALRSAVSVALDYGIEVIEGGGRGAPPVPVALLAQARLAARNRVSLDTVLRRYFAGYALLCDYLIEEVNSADAAGDTDVKRLLYAKTDVFDRLIAAVGQEYARETPARHGSVEERRAKLVECMLEGEVVDPVGLEYVLDQWHLGIVANGLGAKEEVQRLARELDAHLLRVPRHDGSIWAWLGGRRKPDADALARMAPIHGDEGIRLALGEPGEGLPGWRLTHRQACAAAPIALRSPTAVVRYGDVALLASALRDDVFTDSLQALYIGPLSRARDGGGALRETLRAYLSAGGNASSAAAAMGVRRQTVSNRLRRVEELLERPVDSCTAELDAALRLAEIGATHWPRQGTTGVHIDRAGAINSVGG